MRRRLSWLVFVVLLGNPALAPAADPAFAWAIRAGSEAGGEKIRSLAVDDEGNVCITGQFARSADFGAITLESRGDYDCFIAKVAPDGTLLWARTIGGEKTERGYGIDADAQGNVYVTGHYESDHITFGSETVTNGGDFDIFTAKFDRDGNPLWIRGGGGAGYDFGHGLAIDPGGNCLIGGSFVGPATLGGVFLADTPGGRAFAAKYDADGELLWAKASGGTLKSNARGHDLAVDKDGNAYLSGTASPGATFDGRDLPPGDEGVMIVFKLAPAGEFIRATRFGGAATGHAAGVAVDRDGNAYATGSFEGTFTHGDTALATAAGKDFYVAKLDPTGNLAWVRRGGGAGSDITLGIAANPSGGCLVTGDIADAGTLGDEAIPFLSNGGRDGFAAAFDSNGSLQWVLGCGGSEDEVCEDIALDYSGNVFFGGGIGGTVAFGDTNLTVLGDNPRNRDLFLAKIRAK